MTEKLANDKIRQDVRQHYADIARQGGRDAMGREASMGRLFRPLFFVGGRGNA